MFTIFVSRSNCESRFVEYFVKQTALALLFQVLAVQLNPTMAQERQTGLLFLDDGTYRSIPLASTPLMGGIPPSVDMSSSFPVPGNQGRQASCVGWAVAYAMKSAQEKNERSWKLETNDHLFSPSFIYNQIKQSVGCQGGSFIADALNLLRQNGAATLADFPYDERDCDQKPDAVVGARARPFSIADWRRVNVQDVIEVKTQVAAGFPVLIGLIVDNAFKNLKLNQIYTAPDNIERGGHAMVVVGYDDKLSAFKVINSWGTGWGSGGFGWINYNAFRQIAREGYVAQDIIVTSPVSRPSFEGVRVVYFKKAADEGKVEQILDNMGIQYEMAKSTSNIPTSLLTCTPDVDGDKLRTLALALYDAGVRLKRVKFALKNLNVTNRISLESTPTSNRLHALSRSDLLTLNACKLLKSGLDDQ